MAKRRERQTTRQREMGATQSDRDYAIAVRDQIGRLYGFVGSYGTTPTAEIDPQEISKGGGD